MSDTPETEDSTTILEHVVTREGGWRRCYNEGDLVLAMPLDASDEAISCALRAMMRERQTGIGLGRAAVEREVRTSFADMLGFATKAEVADLRERLDACETGVNVLLKR